MSYQTFDDFHATPSFYLDPTQTQPLKQDAILKNRLLGADGGFLTSPLTSYKGVSVFADPSTQTLSPGLEVQDDTLDEINRYALNNNAGGKGLGLDSLDYGNMRIYGMPLESENRPLQANKQQQLGFLPYPDHMPTVTLGRGKKNTRDVGPLDLPAGPPEPVPLSPSIMLSPSSQPKRRNKKALAIKTEQPPAAPQTPKHRSVTSPMPVTPVSSHIGQFDIYGNTKVPFNTPVAPRFTPNQTYMPFTFSELNDLGLGVLDLGQEDGMGKIDPMSMPLDFDSILSMPASAGLMPPSATEQDFSLLSSLPTPALVNSSCLSSPASTWSGHSPLLSPAQTFASYQDSLLPIDPMLQANSPFLQSPVSSHASAYGSANIPQSPFSPRADYAFLSQDPYAMPGSTETIRVARARPKLNRKRSRVDFEEDQSDGEGQSEYGGEDSDYNPTGAAPASLSYAEPPHFKKQRTVSAPIAGRRLKPGPKPRAASGIAPPRPAPSNSASSGGESSTTPNLGYLTSGDEMSEGEDSRGGVPKAVIQSLYRQMQGSTKANGKRYVCLVEGCSRVFPRKSAIESHIQTHLEDKPYVCSEANCGAAFVRQHDLRRHERIHSGTKPFPCPCGKGFARGDALMRHRQRGICVGSLVPRRI